MIRRSHILLVSLLIVSAMGPMVSLAAEGRPEGAAAAGAKQPIVGRCIDFETARWAGDSCNLLTIGGMQHFGIWSPESGHLYRLCELAGHPTCLAAAPDASSKLVAVGTNDGFVEIWNVYFGRLEHKIRVAESDPAHSVALSGDGELLASCSAGKSSGVRIWSIADGKRRHTLRDREQGFGLPVFSADGRRLAAITGILTPGAHVHVYIWELAEEKLVHAPIRVAASRFCELRFGLDGKTVIAVDDGIISFCNLDDDQPPRVVLAPESIAPRTRLGVADGLVGPSGAFFAGATALAPSEDLAASVTEQGTIAIWSPKTRQVVQTLPAPPGEAQFNRRTRSLRYTPDGKQLAGVRADGNVVFWRVP